MLLATLSEEEDLEVVGQAANGQEALDQTRRLKPDVVLMDVNMPKMDGLDATAAIVRQMPGSKVVVVTAFDDEDYAVRLVRAGATGYVLKDSPPDEIIRAIRIAHSGEALIQPRVLIKILRREMSPRGERKGGATLQSLTEREREVLGLIGRGLNNREIGEKLFISEPTVKTHVANLMHKLGFRDRIEAVLYAVHAGL